MVNYFNNFCTLFKLNDYSDLNKRNNKDFKIFISFILIFFFIIFFFFISFLRILKDNNENIKEIKQNIQELNKISFKNKFNEELNFIYECLNQFYIQKFEKQLNPKLSIIIPFYNSRKYLTRLLRSIQNQKLIEIEIIFVDDCSTDNGLELLQEYSKIDKRIIIVENKKNKGNLYTYIKGILSANSKYLLIIDADDMLLSKLKEQYELSENNNIDINDFSFLQGSTDNINLEIQLKDSILYQPEISDICVSGNYPCPCFITKKIIKTEIAKKAVKTIKDEYLNSHILIYADTILFITIFSFSNSYKSYSSLYNQIYIDNSDSITKITNQRQKKVNIIFRDAIYFAQYIYEFNYKSIESFNLHISYTIKTFQWPLSMCENFLLDVNDNHLNSIVNKFLNNINITQENKDKFKEQIKNIQAKINKKINF